MAAPADQRRIAHDGAEIVRQTGVLDNVAQILEAQTTPYRQVREFGEELPVASRIIKVANAYEDFAGERPGASRTAVGDGADQPGSRLRVRPPRWSTPSPGCCAATAEGPAGARPRRARAAVGAPYRRRNARGGQVREDLPASCGAGACPRRAGQCWSVVSSGSGLTRGSPASTK